MSMRPTCLCQEDPLKVDVRHVPIVSVATCLHSNCRATLRLFINQQTNQQVCVCLSLTHVCVSFNCFLDALRMPQLRLVVVMLCDSNLCLNVYFTCVCPHDG